MGGRTKYPAEILVQDNEKVYHTILNDPESCRKLLLMNKLPGRINERSLSFFGFLKKMIMSREICKQRKAVKCIISMLIDCKSNHTLLVPEEEKIIVSKILDNDIAEFLCEALPYPRHSGANDLLQTVYHCLALLSSNDDFYRFHAVYALEAVLRSLHFLCQYLAANPNCHMEKENLTLSSGLALVAIVLHGSVNKCNLVSNSSKVVEGGSILNRISELIITTMGFKNPQTKWKSGLVVRSLLNPWHLGKCFYWDDERLGESIVKKKVCVSKNICTEGNEVRGEVQRRMSLFHQGVQFIHRKSTIEESTIFRVQDNDYCGEDIRIMKLLTLKELKLVIKIIDESIKGLQNCLSSIINSNTDTIFANKNQILLLICQIGKNSLQLIQRRTDAKFCRENIDQDSDFSSQNYSYMFEPLKEMFTILSHSIGGLCADILVKMEFEDDSHSVFKEYMICLELFYQKFGNLCTTLSHKLASQGYLTMLPLLLTSQSYRDDDGMKAACQVVLTYLLSKLAEVELNCSNPFLILSQGLSNLPMHINSWPSVMATHSSEPSATAMLIFSYFYCISSSKPDLAMPFLMPLVYFIKSIFGENGDGYEAKELPAPILKALWFSFSISYLSNGCPINPDIEEASEKLIHFIWGYRVKQKNKDICNIFTYHPALLLWVFSSPVTNSWIKLRVVLLWLQGAESAKPCQEIEKLLTLSRDAFLCLMDIAESGPITVMECALRTLWSCLQNVCLEEQKKISSNLWEILIYIVQRFCGLEDDIERERRAMNVACLLQLAQASTQSEPSSNTVIRLACLLNSALSSRPPTSYQKSVSRNQYLLYLSGLKMLHFLLKISLEKEDTRVASSMLSHYGQLQMLEWAGNLCSPAKPNSGSSVRLPHGKLQDKSISKHFLEDLNSVAFLTLAKLILINPFHSQASVKSISLNSWHLLNAVSCNNEDLCYSAQKLFNALVQVHIVKPTLVSRPFVKIVGNQSEADFFSNTAFVRTLYLQFVMLCTKVSSDIENLCWEFLSLSLQLPNRILTSHLSKLPWNNSLINARLPHDDMESYDPSHSHNFINIFSMSFLHFINQWLDRQRHNQEFLEPSWMRVKKNDGIRTVGSIIFGKTISRIGKALINENCMENASSCSVTNQHKTSVLRETVILVLQFEKYIPDETAVNLKKKLSTLTV